MNHFVTIPSHEGFALRLADLISRLPEELCNLQWTLLALYGVGSTSLGGVPSLEQQVDGSPNGVVLSWEEIRKFANEVDDVYDILLVGFDEMVPAVIDVDSLASVCTIALQLNDSSFWQCFFRDETHAEPFLDRTKSAHSVRDLPSHWKR